MKSISLLKALGLLFLITCIAMACKPTVQPNSQASDSILSNEKYKSQVKVELLKRSPSATPLSLPGELKPFQEVALYAKLTAFVKSVNVDRGSEVHKGDILIVLEAPEIEAQLTEGVAKLHAQESIWLASKQNYYRLLSASKTGGAVAINDLDQQKSIMLADSSAFISQQAHCKSLGALQDYLLIRAPFDGVITDRNIHPGAFVGPTGKGSELPLLQLQENKLLRLAVAIPENMSGIIHLYDSLTFQVNAYSGQLFKAKIIRQAKALDVSIRSEIVEADVLNEQELLKPGMYTHVIIQPTDNPIEYIVAQKAILSNTEGNYVLKVENHKIKRCPVLLSITDQGSVKIHGHQLSENDTIVSVASDNLKDGQLAY